MCTYVFNLDVFVAACNVCYASGKEQWWRSLWVKESISDFLRSDFPLQAKLWNTQLHLHNSTPMTSPASVPLKLAATSLSRDETLQRRYQGLDENMKSKNRCNMWSFSKNVTSRF